MAIITNPTAAKFKQMLTEKKTFLADFYATWCGPCKMLSYVLEDISREMGERIDIVKIDIDKEPELTEEMDITIIPGLFFIKTARLFRVTPAFCRRSACVQDWKSCLAVSRRWSRLLTKAMT